MTEETRKLKLANGVLMPMIGMGTWPLSGPEAAKVVAEGIRSGYRLVDTAANYENEEGVGEGIRASGIPRDEIFVTSKLNAKWHGVDLVAKACAVSAKKMKMDYIDLYLIHWPNPEIGKYAEAWQGLINLLSRGHVRAIGVSNFKEEHLAKIFSETGLMPHVNQVQLNPGITRRALREFHEKHGIRTQSWGPLGQGRGLLRNQKVTDMAKRYSCSPSQLVIAWQLALGLSCVPKSTNPYRLRENLQSYKFRLMEEDISALSSLDGLERVVPDSDLVGN